jgi:diacylglycerol kinase family enzyme
VAARSDGPGPRTDARATLVVNPTATTTRTGLRDLIVAALGGTIALDVHLTTGRGHATELAAVARARGDRAVVVLGGDGTANEVVQALAGGTTALGLVPGGGANVLIRALGGPAEPVAATARLLGALREDRRRRIGLGRAGDRYFTFAAGMGLDATVVRRVEHDPVRKRRLRHAAYVLALAGQWRAGPEARGAILAEVDGAVTGPHLLALVGNASPWSALGRIPLVVHPGASFDRGLDLMTLRVSGLGGLATVAAGALAGGRHVRAPGVLHHHDLPGLTLRAADGLLPVHVDGDPLPSAEEVVFRAVPAALDVLDVRDEGA